MRGWWGRAGAGAAGRGVLGGLGTQPTVHTDSRIDYRTVRRSGIRNKQQKACMGSDLVS